MFRPSMQHSAAGATIPRINNKFIYIKGIFCSTLPSGWAMDSISSLRSSHSFTSGQPSYRYVEQGKKDLYAPVMDNPMKDIGSEGRGRLFKILSLRKDKTGGTKGKFVNTLFRWHCCSTSQTSWSSRCGGWASIPTTRQFPISPRSATYLADFCWPPSFLSPKAAINALDDCLKAAFRHFSHRKVPSEFGEKNLIWDCHNKLDFAPDLKGHLKTRFMNYKFLQHLNFWVERIEIEEN